MDQKPPRKSGRPALPEDARAKKRSVYLTESDWEALIEVGLGNPSNAIRLFLSQAKKRRK